MRKEKVARLARVLGFTLAIWPFVGSSPGGGEEKVKEDLWQLPEVGRCQASSIPGATSNGLAYDAAGVRCVVGDGGCTSHVLN